MRINPDCVRIVLLTIENNLDFGKVMQLHELMKFPLVLSFTRKDIEYSIHQLTTEKMLDCKIYKYINGNCDYLIKDVTPEGHKLCDKIRNETLWSKIKPHLEDVSSVAGIISVISSAASIFL